MEGTRDETHGRVQLYIDPTCVSNYFDLLFTSLMKPVKCPSTNIFKTLRLRDCWADVDETWNVYSMCPRTKLLTSGILNLDPCTAQKK